MTQRRLVTDGVKPVLGGLDAQGGWPAKIQQVELSLEELKTLCSRW